MRVNDLRVDVDPAVVDVVASWGGGERRWRFGGVIPADDCVKVGTIALSIPDTLGALTIDLTLTSRRHQGEEPVLHRRHRALTAMIGSAHSTSTR